MSYTKPAVGTVLPAKENTDVTNPGPVHKSDGLDAWLQAQAQDLAFQNNKDLYDEWKNQEGSSYGINLGNSLSWAVLVAEAEAGGLDFQQVRQGPPVNSLTEGN
jgi:hypothetical protein